MSNELVLRFVNSQSLDGIVEMTCPVYKRAFAGYPWYEDLSDAEVLSRMTSAVSRPGFEGIWFFDGSSEVFVAASWFDELTLESLKQQRGEELQIFVRDLLDRDQTETVLLWQRETLVNPDYQRQGLGRQIKTMMHELLVKRVAETEKRIMLLTRMREDNTGILKINHEFEFSQTGIKMPCSVKPETFHEYWYRLYGPS